MAISSSSVTYTTPPLTADTDTSRQMVASDRGEITQDMITRFRARQESGNSVVPKDDADITFIPYTGSDMYQKQEGVSPLLLLGAAFVGYQLLKKK